MCRAAGEGGRRDQGVDLEQRLGRAAALGGGPRAVPGPGRHPAAGGGLHASQGGHRAPHHRTRVSGDGGVAA